MKIAIDVSSAVYGTGVSDYTIELVRNLPTEHLVLFGSSLRRQGELHTLFPMATVFPLPPTGLHYIWNQFHTLSPDIFLKSYDILHSSDWAQPPTKAKKITTIHDLSPFLYPSELDPSIVRVHKSRMSWVVKECDAVICVSNNTANDLERIFGYPREKIHIIYEALPSRYLLSPSTPPYSDYILAIGTRQPRKNISRLIQSFKTYKSKYSLPANLVIVGEHPQFSSDPNIVFTGYVPNQTLVNLLAGAKAFIAPSLYEGFGLTILGAFHHQVPVSASNTSSHPEVVGDAGVLFDPTDLEAIAEGISKSIKNSKKLVELGKIQLQKFSWTKTAQQTLEAYQSLC